MILFSFLILIQGTYQISKVDLKVKYVNDSKAFSLSPAYYEALYDFYSYELTNDNDKNAEKNALVAFQETFIGNISKYINFDLFYYLIGVYFIMLLLIILLKPIVLYYKTYNRRKQVRKYLSKLKKKNPPNKELIEYYEFCAELNAKMFKPLPKYRAYKEWFNNYKKEEAKFITQEQETKHKIYSY